MAFHLGPAERNNIFASVAFPREDDSRDVWLNADEVTALLDACEDWFRPFVLTAVSTGADRSPLMRMMVRDVEISRGDEATDGSPARSTSATRRRTAARGA